MKIYRLLMAAVLGLVTLFTVISLFRPSEISADCPDSFTVGDSSYTVPDKWCAHRLDSIQVADKTKLVRLLDEFTFEDYRIYVMPKAKRAFEKMALKAKKDSLFFIVDSGYRSASFQKRIIQKRLDAGQDIKRIVQMVAPPGYSQHETGRALDLVPSEARFAYSKEYQWLQKNAKEFGFIESYPENNPDSLDWESWHWLYVDSLASTSVE